MNIIFSLMFLISIVIMLFTSPENILPSMLSGAEKAVKLTLSLMSVYSVFMGIFQILEDTGIADKFALLLKKPIRKLFGKVSPQAEKAIALNLSANILGIGGIATPLGIKACSLMEKEKNYDGIALLIILASTSLQIMPSSVIALAIKHGSNSPYSIVLPSILCTLFSSLFGLLLFKMFTKRKKG